VTADQRPAPACACGVAGCLAAALAREIDRLQEEEAQGLPDPSQATWWWER
jgi:hypothetical protein